MNTKDYLRQIRYVDMRIDNKLEQVERLKSKRESITAMLSDMPRGGNGEDRSHAMLMRIWEIEKEIDEDVDILVDLKTEVRRRIEAMKDDRLRVILEAKYLCFKTWEDIAEAMHITDVRWVYRLHGRALIEFSQIA